MSSPTPQSFLVQGNAAFSEPLPSISNHIHLLDDPLEWDSFGRPAEPELANHLQGFDPFNVPVWDSHFALNGMHCSTCALTIEDALRATPGVIKAEVSAAARRARVVWRPQEVLPSKLLEIVRELGYEALPAKDSASRELNQALNRKALWRWLLATFCMMQVMMYAWPAYEAQAGDLSMEMERLLRWASWVICIPMLIFACGPFFSGAWRDVCHRRVSMDLPVALGMLLTFVVSTLGTFDPEGIFGQEVFFDSLTMFVCFLLTGRWLEIRLRDRTAGALDAVMNRLPDSVERVSANGKYERVALRHIKVGDLVRVLPGEAFSVDGNIERGRTQADEALLTGESKPVARGIGDAVTAGSYNLTATVDVRVDRVGAQTKFAQIVDLMESASTQKPRLAQLADKVAGPFLIAVIGLAAAAAIYWWPTDPGRALMVAAAVLIVTCPCALSLATPVAMLTAAGTLARHGVLVRNLQGLENLASIDTLIFDKTGTLTCDGIQVSEMQTIEAADGALWQSLAAALAQHSIHPVSKAVASFGAQSVLAWNVLSVEEVSGKGLRALVKRMHADIASLEPIWVRLGSCSFTQSERFSIQTQAVYLSQETAHGTSLPLAVFKLNEVLRPDAAFVVKGLKQSGIDVQLMSGDEPQAVANIANAVGIAQGHAQFTPAAKLTAMRVLQEQGAKVAMVGDGLNDGPVLAGADVSFAFGRAVPLARARSDFVVLSDDLDLVLGAVHFARKTLRIVRQNLAWAAAYNAVSVPFALAGLMPAWLAGLGMALSSLLVVLNAARLARKLSADTKKISLTNIPASQLVTGLQVH
ncbi:MAG: cation-translocating P-type ATPase [Comamonas sp.]|nr:cation-translocating P-type ATPase [Comamonas sp.]